MIFNSPESRNKMMKKYYLQLQGFLQSQMKMGNCQLTQEYFQLLGNNLMQTIEQLPIKYANRKLYNFFCLRQLLVFTTPFIWRVHLRNITLATIYVLSSMLVCLPCYSVLVQNKNSSLRIHKNHVLVNTIKLK